MMSDGEEGFERRDAIWERFVFGLLFLLMFAIVQQLLWAVSIAQFLWMLFASRPNEHIAAFGARLGVWAKRAVFYLSGTTDEKPFPWRELD